MYHQPNLSMSDTISIFKNRPTMSPKSIVISKSISGDRESKKVVEQVSTQEKSFSRIYRPLGLKHHVFNQINVCMIHLLAVYYFYVEIKEQLPLTIIIFELVLGYAGGLGVTVGCHRYWAHKSFKAKLPLQILLMILQTTAFQLPIHWWCLQHRVHHKYTDTEADPHNSRRGFWFSHMGWMLLPMRREFISKLKTIDMTDLENDPVVRFQSRYFRIIPKIVKSLVIWYFTLVIIFHYTIPTFFIYHFWKIPLLYCIASACRRYAISLHITGCVNSVAHKWGYKPYNRNITATEGPLLSAFTGGEGWHNYHHTFPWDYKASEYGWQINVSTMVIDFFAYIGWAYDLKTVSSKVVIDTVVHNGNSRN